MSDLIAVKKDLQDLEHKVCAALNAFQRKWNMDIHDMRMIELSRTMGDNYSVKSVRIEVLL